QWASWSYIVFKGTSMGEGTICPMWWTCPSTIKQYEKEERAALAAATVFFPFVSGQR
ncbi:unnamed protein product, partial [Sphagnum balticum]